MKRHALIRASSAAIASLRSLRRNRRGATAMMVAIMAPVMFGGAGVAIDFGRALQIQRSLQGSTDAAAMAGAQYVIDNPIQAITAAQTYGASAGNLNAIANVSVSMVPGYPMLKCFKSTGILCGGTQKANGIQVKQQVNVPTYFVNAVGIKSIPITATSTASASGGFAKPLNVEIVLDTTASMNTADPNCSNNAKIVCALTGVRQILSLLSPSVDNIGLMVFPPVTTATVKDDFCPSSNPTITTYAAATNANYQIVGLSNDYRVSDAATTLNASSDLVQAAGGASCHGVEAVGGISTYYADALTAAQAALPAVTTTSQNVIIFLSDGDANAPATVTLNGVKNVTNMTTANVKNQCHEAITQAGLAAAAGTWVFSVAYGSPTSNSCSTDTGGNATSACATMKAIASDPTKFFSDNETSCPSAANPLPGLISAFEAIGQVLVPARLIPDNTT